MTVDATDDGIESLITKHPEILMVQLVPILQSDLTSTGFNKILSLPSLSSFIMRNLKVLHYKFHSFKIVSKQLQILELTDRWLDTTIDDAWFLQILEQCGSTLKSLNLPCSIITGDLLIDYKGTLPCLENLNISYCKLLTGNGLLNILQFCGSTLKSLDISGTNITGEKIYRYKGNLPCLENLNISNCKLLTENELLNILQLCRSTLKSLDISGTNITGEEDIYRYEGTLPCLENLKLRWCFNLSGCGLYQILRLCGSTLISLHISETDSLNVCIETLMYEFSHIRIKVNKY